METEEREVIEAKLSEISKLLTVSASKTTVPEFLISNEPDDIKSVRIPGIDKSLEKMTVGELINLRGMGSKAAWTVEGVGSNLSINGKSDIADLARLRADEARMRTKIEFR